MRRSLILALGWVGLLACAPVVAQQTTVAGPKDRLTYYFPEPHLPALDHAKDGLHVLDGEFIAVGQTRGDSVVEILARVREATWRENPRVVGGSPGEARVAFGPLQTYLRGDPRFRILAIPAACGGCPPGSRRIVFLPYSDTTGYLVGRPPRGPGRH